MSREVDLYKDKIEVSLDGRQIFYLFFGGAVIVGLVFVLGVMVGRRVEARGHVDRANVTTTADPLAALDRLESGGNRLSFQDALRGNDAPATDVEKQIDAMKDGKPEGAAAKKDDKKAEKKEDLKKDEAKKDEAKKDEPKKEDPKKDEKKDELKKDEKKLEAKNEAKKDELKKDESKKDESKKDEPKKDESKKDSAKLEAKADDKSKSEEKKTDEKKVDDKKLEAKANGDDKKAEAKADKKSKFTLQLSSFQDKGEAQAYLDSIRSSGYQAYVTEGEVDGKQFFRVRMGTYPSMDAATEAKSEFEKSAKKTAIITKL